jgi:hypothetical protein
LGEEVCRAGSGERMAVEGIREAMGRWISETSGGLEKG